jgi:hypothetical protein
MGSTMVGEVDYFPLKTWNDLYSLCIPDIDNDIKWNKLLNVRNYFIDFGLDVLQLQQQKNMGQIELSKYAGRISFMYLADIQTILVNNDVIETREFTKKLVQMLGTSKGGFIANYYSDPDSIGHSNSSIDTMCDEFIRISNEISRGILYK